MPAAVIIVYSPSRSARSAARRRQSRALVARVFADTHRAQVVSVHGGTGANGRAGIVGEVGRGACRLSATEFVLRLCLSFALLDVALHDVVVFHRVGLAVFL